MLEALFSFEKEFFSIAPIVVEILFQHSVRVLNPIRVEKD
jgi:hypothetical protein